MTVRVRSGFDLACWVSLACLMGCSSGGGAPDMATVGADAAGGDVGTGALDVGPAESDGSVLVADEGPAVELDGAAVGDSGAVADSGPIADSGPAADSGTPGAGDAGACGPCTDTNPCTRDVCSGTVCQHIPDHTACPAGSYCGESGCVAGPRACANDASCALADACIVGSCNMATRQCAYRALDGDGDGAAPLVCGGGDCNDADRLVGPDAREACNGRDENCNGVSDEGATYDCQWNAFCSAGSCRCPTGYVRCELLGVVRCGCQTCTQMCQPNAQCIGSRCQ